MSQYESSSYLFLLCSLRFGLTQLYLRGLSSLSLYLLPSLGFSLLGGLSSEPLFEFLLCLGGSCLLSSESRSYCKLFIITLAFYLQIIEMQSQKVVKRPKNGCFDNMQELKLYHLQKIKEKKGPVQNIPIAYEHVYSKKERVNLYYVKPQFKMAALLPLLSKKALEKLKKESHEGVYIVLNKQLLNPKDEETVLQKYEKFKDQNNILHLRYQLHSQNCGYPISGYQIAALFLIVPLVLPVVATKIAFDWTANKVKNIPSISLPSIPKFSILGEKQHSFRFKQQFSLEQRKRKVEELQFDYPDQIIVIVQRHQKSILPQLPFSKFVIESQMTFRNFCMMMQSRISKYFGQQTSESKHSFFFMVGGKIPQHDLKMKQIYEKFKDIDGMLYIVYQDQQTF